MAAAAATYGQDTGPSATGGGGGGGAFYMDGVDIQQQEDGSDGDEKEQVGEREQRHPAGAAVPTCPRK